MKIAFFFNEHKFSGKLTNFFTGCYAYHVAFVDEQSDTMYDMHLIRRKRRWSEYSERHHAVLVDLPVGVNVNVAYLEEQLLTDKNVYGVLDYLMFALRPFFHLFGASTRNAGGVICSEMVYNDMVACGWNVDFPEVPSPCDLFRFLG